MCGDKISVLNDINPAIRHVNEHSPFFIDLTRKCDEVYAGELAGHDSSIPYFIAIGNKNGILTPLQKDLIDVGARLNESEIKSFANLIRDKKDMDYDAILSLIQHYAKDEAFMAREAAKAA